MTYGQHDNLDPYDTPVIAKAGATSWPGTMQNGSDKGVRLLSRMLRRSSDATRQKQVTRIDLSWYCACQRQTVRVGVN